MFLFFPGHMVDIQVLYSLCSLCFTYNFFRTCDILKKEMVMFLSLQFLPSLICEIKHEVRPLSLISLCRTWTKIKKKKGL